MKLLPNNFQGKKPSLEEGPMIYTVSDEYSVNNRIQESKVCKLCMQFMKVIFFVVLAFMFLFVLWGLLITIAYARSWVDQDVPLKCGVTDDAYDRVFDSMPLEPRSYESIYNDIGNEFKPNEVDDMTDNVPETAKTIGYTDDYREMTTSAGLEENSTPLDNFYSYEERR